jgi:predicted outer membrane repeat protein
LENILNGTILQSVLRRRKLVLNSNVFAPHRRFKIKKTFYRTFHLKGEILMMKSNVWKKILPALVAAATVCGGNAFAADDTYVVSSVGVTGNGDTATLYGAVEDWVANATGNDLVINVDSSFGGNFSIVPSAAIANKVTIKGNGHTLTGTTGADRLLGLGDNDNSPNAFSDVTIDNLHLTGNNWNPTIGVSADTWGYGTVRITPIADGKTITIQNDSSINGNTITVNATGGKQDYGAAGLFLSNGGTYGTGTKAIIKETSFSNNTIAINGTVESTGDASSARGAGLWVHDFATTEITKGTISGNKLTTNAAHVGLTGAGAVFAAGNTIDMIVNITDSKVSNNTIEGVNDVAYGAGLYFTNDLNGNKKINAAIDNTTFEGNETKSLSGGSAAGGALAIDSTVTDSGITVKNSTFKNNKATGTASKGGAIYVNNVATLAITADGGHVLFQGNTAESGASIWAETTADVEFNAVGVNDTIIDEDGFHITNVAKFMGLGQTTVTNGYAGTLNIDTGATLNTKGDTSANLITGAGKLNVVSGTTRTDKLTSTGTVNVDGRLLLSDKDNTAKDLTGNGYIFFENIDSLAENDSLLTVSGDNDFAGTATAVDTLGTGVKRDAKDYKVTKDGIAHIADGYLAVASIHNFNVGYQAVQDHLISGRARRLGFLGQSECDPCEPAGCNPCDPCGALVGSSTRSAWVNYVGRNNQYQSSYNGREFWNTTSNGVQVGVDLYRTCKNQFGVLFGYEKSDSDMRTNSIDADDVYFGFYAAHVFRNGADARIVANFGWQNYDAIRTNYDNTNRYASSFDGNTTELNLELGKRFHRSSSLSFRPVAAIDLYINDVDGSQERITHNTGTPVAVALKYNGLSYTQAFLRIGSDFKLEGKRLTLNGGLYYAYDVNDNKLKSTVSSVANTYNLYGSDLGRQVVTFNVGGSLKLGNSFDVFGGFTGNAYVDRDGTPFQSTGYVGGAVRW